MIEVVRQNGLLAVRGHAKNVEVCDAVTALTQTLYISLLELAGLKGQGGPEKGIFDLDLTTLNAEGRLLVESFILGTTLLSRAYPSDLRIKDQAGTS